MKSFGLSVSSSIGEPSGLIAFGVCGALNLWSVPLLPPRHLQTYLLKLTTSERTLNIFWKLPGHVLPRSFWMPCVIEQVLQNAI